MIPITSKYLYFDKDEDTGWVPVIRREILDWLNEYQVKVKIAGSLYWYGSIINVELSPFDFNERQYGDICDENFVFDDPEKEMLFKLTWL